MIVRLLNHDTTLLMFARRRRKGRPCDLLVLVLCCIIQLTTALEPKVRHYYITAEEVRWDYAPSGYDNLRDLPLESSPLAARYTVRNATRIGKVYTKAIYRQYDDATFTRPVAHDPALGFIGPIIRAEAGDQVRITFWNRASRPYSLHPYRFKPSKTKLPGTSVAPDERFEYVWDVPVDAVPHDTDSVLWAYLSQADPVADVHAGLLGPLVIYAPGTLQRPTPGSPEKPKYLDQEVFTVMTITDENLSPYLEVSAAGVPLDTEDPGFLESNRMYHINGYVYNNNPELHLYWGQRVRWYVMSVGMVDDDAHTAHWHGATVLRHGHRMDVIDLLPVSFEALDMIPDNEGQWLFHCHLTHHFDAGMTAFYQVEKLEYTGDEGWNPPEPDEG